MPVIVVADAVVIAYAVAVVYVIVMFFLLLMSSHQSSLLPLFLFVFSVVVICRRQRDN